MVSRKTFTRLQAVSPKILLATVRAELVTERRASQIVRTPRVSSCCVPVTLPLARPITALSALAPGTFAEPTAGHVDKNGVTALWSNVPATALQREGVRARRGVSRISCQKPTG